MYTLSTKVYLDPYTKCYKNVVTINQFPEGPLKSIVRQIKFKNLSAFQNNTYGACCNTPICGCEYALISLNNNSNKLVDWMCVDDIPNLFSFLTNNEYQIDTQITNMMSMNGITMNNSRIIAFINFHK